MKRILIALLLLSVTTVFSQAPDLLNYQGVARDAGGNIINTTIGLKFEILQGSASGTVVYEETNTSLPSSAGIFTAAIGGGFPVVGTFSVINWATGPYFVRVSIDPAGGTSFNTIGTSQLLSVPYALYAKTAGGSAAMPSGTLTGQTLYWNNSANNWVVDNNILNDGNRVVVGDAAITGNNKMKVVSSSPLDSSGLFVYKPLAGPNQSAILGFASGSASNSGTLTFNPIIGGHFIGYNNLNSGSAVGTVGQAFSPGGDAVGIIAIGTSSSTLLGRSVGLYASASGPTYINNFAAVFDRGKVVVNDTLIINTNGNINDVLTRGINGKAHWQSPGAALGPWARTNIGGFDNVHLVNNSDLVNIGLPTGVSANEKLHVHSVTGDAYINLSTSIGSNNVGLVFGESSNISKAFLTFDNTSNSLTYRHFAKRVFFMDGNNQNFFFGKIPVGATSPSQMNIYDSVGSVISRPILKLINMAGSGGNNPTGIYLGDDFNTGLSIAHDKQGTVDHIHIGNSSLNTFYHTFTNNGEFYPGSNGSLGFTNISGGPTATSDLNFNASTSGRIVFNGGHIKGVMPAINVSTTSVTGGFSPVASATCISCNDIRGTVSFSTGVTGFLATNFADVVISFNKPYATLPNISLTPLTDIQGLSFMVANVTTTTFTVRIYRSSNSTVPPSVPSSLFKFNYLVIE